jgi:hypothetical protein
VILNQGEFGFGGAAGFAQDFGREADFANIMEGSGRFNPLI